MGVDLVTTALVGRSADLRMLQLFCRFADPARASLLLRGEPGVGKTALLESTSAWAAAEGLTVLHACAVRAEVANDFCTLNQLLLPLEGWLARLDPDDRRVLSEALGFVEGSSGDRRAIAAAALALLRLAAAEQPLLLVVDDLEWADQATAQTLGLLLPDLDGSRVRFLGAARGHDAGFFDTTVVPGRPVLPLDPAAASQLVSRHFPTLGSRELDGILAAGRGNPLALLELPRALSQPSLAPKVPVMSPLSRRVRQAFAADLEVLPADTRRLLLALALEGSELEGSGDLTLWGSGAGSAELQPAERAGLVVVDPATHRFVFGHPLVPLTITGLATSDERRTAHQELARLLTAWPERRALHLAGATSTPDEEIADELEAAARLIARRGDPAASVTMHLRSAKLSENHTKKAQRLVRAAQLSACVTGHVSIGADLLREAVRSDPGVTGSLRYAVTSSAVALHGRGDTVAAHRCLVDALGVHLDQLEVDREAVAEAIQALFDLCRWTQRREHWSSVSAILTGSGYGWGPSGSEQGGTAGRDGAVVALDLLCTSAEEAYTAGDWDRAQQLADEGLAACERRGDQLLSWTLRWVQALVAAGRGDLAMVDEHTEAMLQWADRHRVGRVRSYAHHVRALAALGRGDFQQAYRESTAAAPEEFLLLGGPGELEAAVCLVESATHTQRHDEAVRRAAVLRARTNDAHGALPRTALLVATSTALASPEPGRAELFECAIAQPNAGHYPFDLARAHLAYGQQLRRSRATSVARTHLRKALDLFTGLDARPWMERTRIELSATAETRNQVEPSLALTPQERTVVQLAAAGHSNKQIAEKLFLTHRTVAAHLHQVFRKLGVDSRAALRDAMAGQTYDPLPSALLPHQRGLAQRLIVHEDGRDRAARRPQQALLLSS